MLNLDRLRILLALHRHGSVGGAAAELHVTTSAVSQQMSKLEQETGQRLTARHGRGVRLTDAGELLARHADLILSQLERAHADLEAHRGQPVGELQIAAFPTAARGLLPAALALLAADHPHLHICLAELEPEEAVRRLIHRDIDLAIVLDWSDRPISLPSGLARALLFEDVVDAAVPSSHPHAAAELVDLSDFADEAWISWPEGEFCHDWLVSTLRADGIEPRITHRAREHHTQLALVAQGLGVAIAPRLGGSPVPDGVTIVPLRHPTRRLVYATWREDANRRPSIQTALDALRQVAASLPGPTISHHTP